MENLIEISKVFAAVVAPIAGFLKIYPAFRGRHSRNLKQRHIQMKDFFKEGGLASHPFLIEGSFAAALGHTKLNHTEICLLLKQKNPTQFMETYIKVRAYLKPSLCGRRFELKSVASAPKLRNVLIATLFILYCISMSIAVFILAFDMPKYILNQLWNRAASEGIIAVFLFCIGTQFLVWSAHLSWAHQLNQKQVVEA